MTSPDPGLPDLLRQRRLAGGIVLAVVLLAGVNWIQRPEQALRWLLVMITLPLAWFGMSLWSFWMRRFRASSVDDELAIQRYVRAALTLMVLAFGIRQIALVCLGVWVGFGDRGADLEVERRILGIATSAVFIVIGNGLPKILTPLAILPLHLAERVTVARRFIGATWVICGAAMAAAFLLLPLGSARILERWSIVGALLSMFGAIIWMNAVPARREP